MVGLAVDDRRPFDIDVVMQRVREAVRPFPRAMLFQLAEEGFRGVFQQLVACLISVRTRDEASLVAARRLFDQASTPSGVAELDINAIDALIQGCAFHLTKAEQIHTIAELTLAEHGNELPCSFEVLTSFPGIGPKCANLALGIACGQAQLGVDTHVHRIANRWGYVHTNTPERTLAALTARLPRQYWLEINAQLVPFGKHICTPTQPHCSTCPLLDMCQQVGVTTHR
jgi:endonuclease III